MVIIRRTLIASVATVVSLWLAIASFAQSTKPMVPADILRIAGVTDAQISPDGRMVVYTVSTIDGDSSRNTLWLARPDPFLPPSSPTPTPRQPTAERPQPVWAEVRRPPAELLPPGWTGSNPRWSPDNTMVAFQSNREGQNGIWLINIATRKPRFIAAVENTNFHISYAGESFAWSPDSKRIAYISATQETATTAKNPDDPRVIDRLQYKSRTAFSDNRRSHVWIVEIDRPEPRQLTSGPFYDHAVTFNPNGREIAFLSNHEPDPDAVNNSDIFAVDIGGQVRQLTETRGCEYEPRWSPDGKWIAYTATKREITTIDSIAEDAHVWVVGSEGGQGRELSSDLDRRARGVRWSTNSRNLYFAAGDHGQTKLWTVRVDGGDVRELFTPLDSKPDEDVKLPWVRYRPFQISGLSVSSTTIPLLAFVLSDSLHPGEVWIAPAAFEKDFQRLSNHNDGFLRSVSLIEPEEIKFSSSDGTPIQGWLIRPAGWREDRKFPMILSVHGGPHGMSGWGFNATFQVFAARGYAVLYMNPRGSSGYGQKFSDGTIGDWGGGDYRDLMAGVDQTLRRHTWINPDGLGVTGGSYGGFMTNWIITQTPRFKAAVAVASVSNLISFYATSVYQDLIHAEFGGFPWDNYELLWQLSPVRHISQAQTPTMLIHGELDHDVHITQAEEMYMALKRRGVQSVLVRYPREGHGLREPKHRVDALERTLSWFDRFLK